MPAPIIAAAAGAARTGGQVAARAGAAAGRAGAQAARRGAQAGARVAKRGGQKASGAAATGARKGAEGAARSGTRAAGRAPRAGAGGARVAAQNLPRGRGWNYQRPGGPPGEPGGPRGAAGRTQGAVSRADVADVAELVGKRLARAGLRRLLRRKRKDEGRGRHPKAVLHKVRRRGRKTRRRMLLIVIFLLFLLPLAIGAVGTAQSSDGAASQDLAGSQFGTVSGIPYADVFNQTAALGIDPRLVAAVAWVETGGFDTDVITCRRASPKGARGIMQFRPGTAAELGIDPCKPAEAIPAGARYLLSQYQTFGTWELALAAYNAGPGKVQAAGGIPNIPETRAYVPKVLGQFEAYKQQFPGGTVSGTGPPGGPRGSTERYTERNLPATTQRLVDAVVPLFGRGYGIGCFGSRSGPSDHPEGKACDFMMSKLGTRAAGDDLAQGDALAAWLQANAAELDITYIIWKNHIWSRSRADEGWRHQHPETGQGNTFLHYDHVHVSVS